MQEREWCPTIDSTLLKHLLETSFLPPAETQLDNLVRWLGSNSVGPGEEVKLDPSVRQATIGAVSPSGFWFIVDAATTRGLVNVQRTGSDGAAYARLTMAGWTRYESLAAKAEQLKTAFMAMAFNDPITDHLFRKYLKPAALKAGFTLVRQDEQSKAGLIDYQMEANIRDAAFVVAELSRGNQGSYWEAGFATALGKPVFYLCESNIFRSKGTHFDTSHHYTILWSREEMQAAADELKAAIRRSLPTEARLDDEDG